MSTVKSKKIYFFQLNLIQNKLNKITGINEELIFEKEEIKNILNDLYTTKMERTPNNTKIIEVIPDGEELFEIIELNDDYMFAKICRMNLSNTVALRDVITYSSEDVPMKDNQNLEVFTFLYLDLETMIITYLNINGAPRVNVIKQLVGCAYPGKGLVTKLSAILSKDIITEIAKKDIIGSLEFSVCVPTDQVLAKDLIVDGIEFDELRNIKQVTRNFQFAVLKNQSILDKSSYIKNVYDKCMSNFALVTKLSVKAKNEHGKMESFNLLEYQFTSKINIESIENMKATEFKTELINKYNSKKRELLQNIS